MTPDPTEPDWTTGPARTAIVIVLAAVATIGVAYAVTTGRTRPPPPQPREANAVAPVTTATESSPELLIDVNTAGAARLALLPGIGPALAERIVQSRETDGPYRSLNDLDRVSGIGPRTIEKLRPHATASQPGSE